MSKQKRMETKLCLRLVIAVTLGVYSKGYLSEERWMKLLHERDQYTPLYIAPLLPILEIVASLI